MNNAVKSTCILTLSAMIWGFAFVAQRSGMEHVGPFFFNGVRTMLGALTLIVFLLIQSGARRGARASKLPPSTDLARARAAGKPAAFLNDERKTGARAAQTEQGVQIWRSPDPGRAIAARRVGERRDTAKSQRKAGRRHDQAHRGSF
jgi:hypothetical protein